MIETYSNILGNFDKYMEIGIWTIGAVLVVPSALFLAGYSYADIKDKIKTKFLVKRDKVNKLEKTLRV